MAGREKTELDELMARLADGDRSVFSRVFELLWPPTERLCRSLLRSEADAADAAQEALYKILERAHDYDPNRAALPWALAIAGWECRTLAQKRRRRRETSDELPLTREGGPRPEDDVIQKELTEAALAALGELSEADRDTLTATFWDEAASVSGATLRKRRERALERLRKSFRRLYGLD